MNDGSNAQIQRVTNNNIIYTLDIDKKTANIVDYDSDIEDCIIPRSINYKSNEYIVKSILRYAFSYSSIKSIQFPSDSELEVIEKGAFNNTKIESITIPSKLIELKEGWCKQTSKLNKIIVDPNNPRYCCIDGKIIIGKSIIEHENYDLLVFIARDIKTINIPNSIKCICSYSFSISKIESIAIPSEVTIICKYAFYLCYNLKRFDIPNDSKLQIIEKEAFNGAKIDRFNFPSSLITLKGDWCDSVDFNHINVMPNNPRFCKYDDKLIIGKSNPQQKIYNEIVLAARDIKEVIIPSFIEHICCCAFNSCFELEEVKILDYSKLKTIGKRAFSNTLIKNFTISSNITHIGKAAFFGCENIQYINIDPNSKIQKFDKMVFSSTNIEKIIIPSEVTRIEKEALFNCTSLQKVEIPRDSKLQIIANNAFFQSAIMSLKIPPNVVQIGYGAFGRCYDLQIIEFDDNSQIKCIHQSMFYDVDRSEDDYINVIFVDTILMVPVNVSKRLKL